MKNKFRKTERFCTSNSRGMGSIPGQGRSHMTCGVAKKLKKKKKDKNICSFDGFREVFQRCFREECSNFFLRRWEEMGVYVLLM